MKIFPRPDGCPRCSTSHNHFALEDIEVDYTSVEISQTCSCGSRWKDTFILTGYDYNLDHGNPAMDFSEYVDMNGCRCPFCHSSTLQKHELTLDVYWSESMKGILYMKSNCLYCEKDWNDNFELDDTEFF